MSSRRLTEILALGAGWSLLALAVLVAIEVTARKLFTYSLQGVDEIGGYVLALASVIGFTYALENHAHIRVDLALKYAGPRLRAVLHLVAHACLAAVALLLAWRAAAVLLRSWSLDATAPTPLGTALVYPQGVWMLGLAAFAALSVKQVVELLVICARRGVGAVNQHFAGSSMEDELRSESGEALRRSGAS